MELILGNDAVRCGSLWGGDCLEFVTPRAQYRCKDTKHTFGAMGEIVRDGLKEGIPLRELMKLNGDPSTMELDERTQDHAVQYRKGRDILAVCPNASYEVLAKIVATRELMSTYSVAANLGASGILLTELSKSLDTLVRANVAANLSTPQGVLETLFTDRELSVRSALAANPCLPEDLCDLLARDSAGPVRQSLGNNMNITPTAVSLLSRSPDAQDRQVAASHHKLEALDASYLATDTDWRVRAAVATRWANVGLLDKLALDDNTGVRSSVAQNSAISPEIFDRLSRDSQYAVRYKLARNAKLPIEIFARLVLDPHPGVRKNVFQESISRFAPNKAAFESILVVNPRIAWLAIYFPFELDDNLANLVVNSCAGVELVIDDFMGLSQAKLELIASWLLEGVIKLDTPSSVVLLQLFLNEVEPSSWTRLLSQFILSQANPTVVYQVRGMLNAR